MNPASVAVHLLVLIGVFFTVRAIIRYKSDSCSGRTGDCTQCSYHK